MTWGKEPRALAPVASIAPRQTDDLYPVRFVGAGLKPAPTGDINRLSDWLVSFHSELIIIPDFPQKSRLEFFGYLMPA